MSDYVLVTGASGFIGSNLVESLINDGKIVISTIRRIKPDIFISGDISKSITTFIDLTACAVINSLKDIMLKFNVKEVYHLASQPIVSKSREDPVGTYRSNIIGTANVLEACRHTNVSDILVMSTDKVYGDGLDATIKSSFKATEPYSTSKICSELIVSDFRREYGMNITVARPCNVYGFDPLNSSRLIPNTIMRLLKGEKPIIYNDNAIRQFIHVDDVVSFLKQIQGSGKTIGIGSPHVYTIRDLVNLICELMDSKIRPKVVEVAFNEIYQQSLKYDTTKEYIDMEDGLRDTINKFTDFHNKLKRLDVTLKY